MHINFARTPFLTALTLAVFATAASAQQPAEFEPGALADMGLRAALFRAAPGEALPFRPAKDRSVEYLFVRGHAGQENLDRPTPDAAGNLSATLPDPGAVLIGYDLAPWTHVLTQADLDLLADEVFAGYAGARPAPGAKVRRVVCGKILTRAMDQNPEPSSVATSKTGQAAELRPYFDPTLTMVGGHMPFRMYIDGDKAPRVKLRAWPAGGGAAQTVTASKDGFATIVLTAPGEWRVTFDALRSSTKEDAEGRSIETNWTWYRGEIAFETPARMEAPR